MTAQGADAASLTSVTIEDTDGCPRYLARVITGVRFGASPPIVQCRLHRCGLRPLGNLVDATNYVLLLTGQPLHAFDLDRLAEGRIVVRDARPGEKLETLDTDVRELEPSDVVIADARDPQAVAGVMGGGASEVSASTTRVLLESATFDPMRIAKTSRRLGLSTEASRRFERGADPEMVPDAAAICASLIAAWSGGTVAPGAVDVGGPPPRRVLALRRERVPWLIGVDIPVAQQDAWLTGLGCVVSGDEITVPSWRPDLEREVDLLEEIGRLHGFNEVPARLPKGGRGALTRRQLLRRRVREVMRGAGLSEANLPSFLGEAELVAVGYEGAAIPLTNPLSSEQDRLRPTLVPGLLAAAQRNVNRGTRNVRLFEIGTVFGAWPADAELPVEQIHLGVILAGPASLESWYADDRPVDALDAKGIVETLLGALGIDAFELGPYDAMPFHPGRSARVLVDGVDVGLFGEVRPSVRRGFDTDAGAAIIELDLGTLIDLAPAVLQVRDLPRFPPVTRDISLVVDEDVASGALVATIRAAAGGALESATLFDIYRGAPIPPGRKNLAFRLTLRAPDRTLTSEEADAARSAAVDALVAGHGAEIR